MRRRVLPALTLAALACSGARKPDAAPPALVEPTGIALEMRYAKPDNFLHEAVYPCARCLLRPETAAALERVEAALAKDGRHLKLWDCYRPRSVQLAMWKLVPDPRFVADPSKGSVHNRGGAVDATLVDSTGNELLMPTHHDDFTPAAYADAPASPEAAANRALLTKAMAAEGFTVMPTEWWHFDYAGSRSWPLLGDAPLCVSGASSAPSPPAPAPSATPSPSPTTRSSPRPGGSASP